MELTSPSPLPEIVIIEQTVFNDSRGWFCESYSKRSMKQHGIDVEFVQDNHSYSIKKGVIRGLHYQKPPFAQSKLVRCTRGRVFDVVVDIRHGSPNFAKWFGIVLSRENRKQLFIPKGFAHGFLTLEDDCEVQYKVDNFYSHQHDRSIKFDDPDIGIEWGLAEVVLSDKDMKAPRICEIDRDFTWEGYR